MIEDRHRGGLDPLRLTGHEKKGTFLINSTPQNAAHHTLSLERQQHLWQYCTACSLNERLRRSNQLTGFQVFSDVTRRRWVFCVSNIGGTSGATLLSIEHKIPEDLNPQELALRPEYSVLGSFGIFTSIFVKNINVYLEQGPSWEGNTVSVATCPPHTLQPEGSSACSHPRFGSRSSPEDTRPSFQTTSEASHSFAYYWMFL
jgi:hypothetical protein